MPSNALAKFTERMQEVKKLLSLCTKPSANMRTAQRNKSRDDALLRGAIVLLCSHIEGFFEDIVTDTILAYDRLADKIEYIPEKIRANQVMGAESLWENTDRNTRWSYIQKCGDHPLLKSSGNKPQGCLDATIHIDGFSNPGTKQIKKLFFTVGIDDVWSVFRIHESNMVFKSTIDSIVERRNKIAHGDSAAMVTLSDALLYVERAERVAYVFNDIMFQHINLGLSVQDCWAQLNELG